MRKFLFFIVVLLPCFAYAFDVVGYIYRSDSVSHLTSDIVIRQNASLENHIQKITLIAPQAYQVNASGTVWGEVDPLVMAQAKAHHVGVMPLLTNQNFDSKITDRFLSDPAAVKKAIQSMVALCQQENFYGIQVDFEHISLKDKALLTQFYVAAASALHAQHFHISIAMIPRISDDVPATDHDRSALEHWNGGYDYGALGKASDFVTLMAYDQHGGGTTPGSSCEPAWLKQVILYALNYIPANKISLGLPVHSSYWYTAVGRDLYASEADITYQQAAYVLREHHANIVWDKKTNTPYAMFSQDNLNRFVFLQDAATFKIQLALVKEYHLRGVSLWCLGYEDPAIWTML